ncbi:MAG: hypothetical protein ACKV2V_03255 [Blastocatellia bacterium]
MNPDFIAGVSVPTQPPAQFAAAIGARIIPDEWQTAGGRVVYLGECRTDTREIRLNTWAIRHVAAAARQAFAPAEQEWAGEQRITEVVLAHELFHILHGGAGPRAENAAHAFVAAWLRMPFSPARYQLLLQIPEPR